MHGRRNVWSSYGAVLCAAVVASACGGTTASSSGAGESGGAPGAGGASAGTGGRAPVPLGGSCRLNSDCVEPLVCPSGKCQSQCQDSRDCATGERCSPVADAGGAGVCEAPSETSCHYNSDCPAPLVCAIDRVCRIQCAADRDCTANQRCLSSVCVDATDAGP